MDRFHQGLEYLWIFWGYGIADNRFLNGNETVLSIEFCSIHTGLLLIPTYFAMQKNKVWAYWVGAFGMAGVCYVTIVYVISDWHLGWPHISPRPYDFWVKFLLTQTPYIFYGGFAAFCAMYVGTELAIANRIGGDTKSKEVERFLKFAVVGAVGDSSTSTRSKAASKSREISVRTFWAVP